MLSMIAGIGGFPCQCDSLMKVEPEFVNAQRLIVQIDCLSMCRMFLSESVNNKSPTSLSGKWGLFFAEDSLHDDGRRLS
jgi:hypothetical protein